MILTIALNPSVDRRYNIEGFKKGGVFKTDNFLYTPGGKGINVTKIIKSFNEPVNVTGFLGGRNGKYIGDNLYDMDIDHSFISINGETRSCLAILSDDGRQTEILERGPSISSQSVSIFYESYRRMLKSSKIVCASGSLPPGLPLDTYRDLVFMAKEEGKRFILDASGDALKYGIESGPFLVRVNRYELENLMKCRIESEKDIIKASEYILENDVEFVVASLGKLGLIVSSSKEIYRIKVPNIEIVNTAGSGDAIVAGMAVSLFREYDIETMLKIGAACGTASHMEAEVGKINMQNMKKVMSEIKIEKIK